jgi:hypothetical protein
MSASIWNPGNFSGIFLSGVNVKDFGAVGDGVTDDYAAIMAAINSVSYGTGFYISGPAVYFPPGTYYCSETIQLKKSVKLWGDGSGMQSASTALIKWPSAKIGIIVHRYNTIDSTVEGTPTTAGDASIIEGLQLQGGGGGTSYHGIWLRARALIKNCYIIEFGGNGIHVVADTAAVPAKLGNANCWRVENCVTILNGQHGLYTEGGDANAGYCLGLDSSNNVGWGIYDSSFLGNTYLGCHCAANTLGSYKADNSNARNAFVSCYTEGGQDMQVAPSSIVVGGLHNTTSGNVGTSPHIDSGLGFLRLLNTPVVPELGVYFGSSEVSRSSDTNTLDAYTEGTSVPVATNMTVVGTATYSCNYTRVGNIVRFDITISVSGGTTAATANSTYLTLPITPSNRSVCNVVDGNVNSLGNGFIDTSGRVYMPTWTARSTTVYVSGAYQISTTAA